MKKHFLLLVMALMSLTGWAQDISQCDVQISGTGIYTYDGTAKSVTLIVKMANASTAISPSNYDVMYYASDGTTAVAADKLIPAGSYYVSAKGKGTYTGETAKVAFTINPALMSGATIVTVPVAASAGFVYDGTAKTFTTVNVTYGSTDLVKDKDYTISYTNNINAGSGDNGPKLVVTGIGNYAGTKEQKFDIAAIDLPTYATEGAYTFTAVTTNPVYTGAEATILPTIVVKSGTKTLVEDTDYEVRWYAAGATDYLKKTVGSGTSAVTVKANPTKAGTYTAKVFGKGNYNAGSGITGAGTTADPEWTLTVDQAPITATIKAITSEYSGYSQADQDAYAQVKTNWEFSGIVSADAANANAIKDQFVVDAATAQYSGTATYPDNYALTLGGVTINTTSGTGAEYAKNYTIANYTDGKLTITKKEVKLQAQNVTKKVGEDDPAFTLTSNYTGIFSDKIEGVTFTREKQGTADGEKVGTYAITPVYSAAKVTRTSSYPTTTTTDVTDYYSFALADSKGKLTIEPGGVIVTIKDAEKFYGEEDPEFGWTVTGLQEGDVLDFDASKITRSPGDEPGTYSLTATVENPDPVKYAAVSVSNGIFTIKKAQLTVTLPAQNLKLNDKATALTNEGIVVTGINNDDVAATLYTLAFNAEATSGDGGIPSAELTSGALNTNNKTYDKGYKLTLNAGTGASVGKGPVDHYEILVKAATTTTAAEYGSSITGKIIVGTGTTKAIDLTSEDGALTKIKNQAGETQNVKINFAKRNGRTLGGERNWVAGKWVTMTLPFDISVAGLSEALGYAIVNVIDPSRTVVDGTGSKFYGKLTMKGGNGSDKVLVANKPFLVKIADDMDVKENYDFGAQKIVAPDDLTVDAGQGAKFVGTYAKKTVTKDDDAAIWFMLGNADGWAYIGSTSPNTWDIVPFEAYIDMSALPAEARNITFFAEELDGSVTAIKSISTDKVGAKLSGEGWYNLNGVKLQGAPTQKGIYIQNGKKVIVK